MTVVVWVLLVWCLVSVPVALAAGRFLARHGDGAATPSPQPVFDRALGADVA